MHPIIHREICKARNKHIFEQCHIPKQARNLKCAHDSQLGNLIWSPTSDIHLIVKDDFPGSGLIYPGYQVYKGSFPRTVGANQPADFTSLKREIHPIDCNQTAKLLFKFFGLNNCVHLLLHKSKHRIFNQGKFSFLLSCRPN